MPRKQAISSCQCCVYTPLPSWKTPRVDELNQRLVRFDVDAKGLSVGSSLVRQDPYPTGNDPSGGDLAQLVAAAILDGQVSGQLFVDILPFAYGKRVASAGFGMRFVPPFIIGTSNVTVQALVPVHQAGPPTHYTYSQYRLGGIGGLVGPVESQFEAVGNRGITAFLQLLPGSPGEAWRASIYQAPHYRPTFFRNPPAAVRQGAPEWEAVGDNDGAGWPPVPNEAGEPVEGSAVQQIPIWQAGSHSYVPLSYEPNTASEIFANTFWALNGNVRYSRCQTCRDWWACRFRLALDDQERLWMPLGNYAHGTQATISVFLSQLVSNFEVSNTPLVWGGFSTNSSLASPSASMPIVKVVQSKTQTPGTVFATAYARADDESLFELGGWDGSTPLGLIYKTGRSNFAQVGFSKDPLAGVSFGSSGSYVGSLAVYRNGALEATLTNTAKAANWQSAAIEEATTEEGSYLLVGNNTADDSNGPMFVLSSLVIDKTPPIGVVKQIGDIYEGDATGLLPEWGVGFNFGNTPEMFRCLEESEPCGGGRGWVNDADGGPVANPATLPEGQYSFRQGGPIRDRAANEMGHLPRLSFNVRKRIGQNAYGPSASIELPENKRGTFVSSGSCCRSLLYDQPVLSFVIRFDRPVDKLSVSHFRLERRDADSGWEAIDLPLSGDPPTESSAPDLTPDERSVLTGNVVIAKKSAKEYTLTFPQGVRVFSKIEQLPNSIFTLTFDPRFVTGNDAIQVLDDAGQVITDQKCDLATRVMWGIMPEAGKNLDRINTQVSVGIVGGVSSVSKEIAVSETRERPNQINVEASTNVTVQADAIKTTEVEPCGIGFNPNMPPHPFVATEGDTNSYGFFGIPTSIYPAPAAVVPKCAAPTAPQKHSSAICSQGEIVGFNVTFNVTTGFDAGHVAAVQNHVTNFYGSEWNVWSVISHYTSVAQEHHGKATPPLEPPPWEVPPAWDNFHQSSAYTPAPIPSSRQLSFASTLSGHKCQQNVWSLNGLGSHQGWLTASRDVSAYSQLGTGFLGRLNLGIRGYYAHVFTKSDFREAIYQPGDTYFDGWAGGPYLQANQTDYNWVPWALGPFTLTPSQEVALAQGQSVSVLESSSTSATFSVNSQLRSQFHAYLFLLNERTPPSVVIFLNPQNTKDDPNKVMAHLYILQSLSWTTRYIVTLTPTFA